MSIKFVAKLQASKADCEKSIKANAAALDALLDEIGAAEETPEQTEKVKGFKAAIESAEADIVTLDKRIAEQAENRRKYLDLAPAAEQPERVPAEPKRPKWRDNGGEFIAAVIRAGAVQAGAAHGVIDPRLRYSAAVTGGSEQVPSEGGFLVGAEEMPGLWDRVVAGSDVLGLIDKKQIGANFNSAVFYAADHPSRADGSRNAGARHYWLGEGSEVTASTPKIRKVEIKLKKVGSLYYATDELLQDATAMQSFVTDEFAKEIAFAVAQAVMVGDGSNKPLGMLNATNAARISITKESGQSAATMLAKNIMKMYARFHHPNLKNVTKVRWVYNQNIIPELHSLNLAVGTGGVPVFMPANGLSDSPYGTLYGIPMMPNEFAASLGTVNDLSLIDFSEYWFIEKGGVEQASSMHIRFAFGEQAFRWMYRCGGQPIWPAAMIPLNGTSDTTSPYVVLETRS